MRELRSDYDATHYPTKLFPLRGRQPDRKRPHLSLSRHLLPVGEGSKLRLRYNLQSSLKKHPPDNFARRIQRKMPRDVLQPVTRQPLPQRSIPV